jgi:hypothetical protein
MYTSWRAGIWLALSLAAATLEAPGVTGEVERSNAPETGLKIIALGTYTAIRSIRRPLGQLIYATQPRIDLLLTFN